MLNQFKFATTEWEWGKEGALQIMVGSRTFSADNKQIRRGGRGDQPVTGRGPQLQATHS